MRMVLRLVLILILLGILLWKFWGHEYFANKHLERVRSYQVCQSELDCVFTRKTCCEVCPSFPINIRYESKFRDTPDCDNVRCNAMGCATSDIVRPKCINNFCSS